MPALRLISSTGDQTFELADGRTLVVGRGVTSDIAIYDPTISRRHAELSVGPDGVQVKDLGSSNGTCINGARITGRPARARGHRHLRQGHLPPQRARRPAAAIQRPAIAAEAGPPAGQIVRQLVVSRRRAARASRAGTARPRASSGSGRDRRGPPGAQAPDAARGLAEALGRVRPRPAAPHDRRRDLRDHERGPGHHRCSGTRRRASWCPTISRSRQGDVQPLQVPRSIADKVVQERVAVVSQNAPADSRFRGQSILLQSVRSAMCSPLMASADRVLGLLYVDNLTTTNTFTDEDLQFLVAFSGLAAIGIKNSRYAEQIRREATVRSNFERYFAPNVAADIAQQDGRHPPGRRAPAHHRAVQRHPRLHRDGGVDGPRRDRPAPERVLHRDGGGHLRARRHARQVHRRRDHGALGRADRAHRRPRPGAPRRARDAARRSPGSTSAGSARAGPRSGSASGINHGEVFAGQHRQPPAAGVHRDRRRGERRRPALRRGGPGRDPGERGAAGSGAGSGDLRVTCRRWRSRARPRSCRSTGCAEVRASAHLASPPRCRSGRPRTGSRAPPARAARAPAGSAAPSR